jgi:hypothetical protein
MRGGLVLLAAPMRGELLLAALMRGGLVSP